jgi:hypothetical protein
LRPDARRANTSHNPRIRSKNGVGGDWLLFRRRLRRQDKKDRARFDSVSPLPLAPQETARIRHDSAPLRRVRGRSRNAFFSRSSRFTMMGGFSTPFFRFDPPRENHTRARRVHDAAIVRTEKFEPYGATNLGSMGEAHIKFPSSKARQLKRAGRRATTQAPPQSGAGAHL